MPDVYSNAGYQKPDGYYYLVYDTIGQWHLVNYSSYYAGTYYQHTLTDLILGESTSVSRSYDLAGVERLTYEGLLAYLSLLRDYPTDFLQGVDPDFRMLQVYPVAPREWTAERLQGLMETLDRDVLNL